MVDLVGYTLAVVALYLTAVTVTVEDDSSNLPPLGVVWLAHYSLTTSYTVSDTDSDLPNRYYSLPMSDTQTSNRRTDVPAFYFDGGAGTYVGTAILATLVTLVTLGIALPLSLIHI